jgi:hypothetical protein
MLLLSVALMLLIAGCTALLLLRMPFKATKRRPQFLLAPIIVAAAGVQVALIAMATADPAGAQTSLKSVARTPIFDGSQPARTPDPSRELFKHIPVVDTPPSFIESERTSG